MFPFFSRFLLFHSFNCVLSHTHSLTFTQAYTISIFIFSFFFYTHCSLFTWACHFSFFLYRYNCNCFVSVIFFCFCINYKVEIVFYVLHFDIRNATKMKDKIPTNVEEMKWCCFILVTCKIHKFRHFFTEIFFLLFFVPKYFALIHFYFDFLPI